MLERVFEIERRRAAKDIREGSEILRELARKAAPGTWRTVPGEDGTSRLLARDDQEAAVFTGLWAPNTGRFVDAMQPNTAYLVAELLSLSPDMVRRGELPTRLQTALHSLAKAFPQDLRTI